MNYLASPLAIDEIKAISQFSISVSIGEWLNNKNFCSKPIETHLLKIMKMNEESDHPLNIRSFDGKNINFESAFLKVKIHINKIEESNDYLSKIPLETLFIELFNFHSNILSEIDTKYYENCK